jgi:hypothetical protein
MIFHPEGGGDTFIGNVGSHMDYMVLYPRRWQHSSIRDKMGLKRLKCYELMERNWLTMVSGLKTFLQNHLDTLLKRLQLKLTVLTEDNF